MVASVQLKHSVSVDWKVSGPQKKNLSPGCVTWLYLKNGVVFPSFRRDVKLLVLKLFAYSWPEKIQPPFPKPALKEQLKAR